jgi:alkanesulfonate monooxygenase SsuD/methylene tetrahydromethanopterin reductase-like flavin-dependent oxidoreductase (luciferase family)
MRDRIRLGLALGGPTDAASWRATIDLAAWADAHGFDSIWVPEGHLRGGATSAPLVALAAIAARTTRVRLGTTSLLLSIHAPARIAAEVATLDQLSAGRVILGVGRGFDPAMFRAFGIDPREKRDRFDDALDAILAAWREPAADVVPVQSPHPPIWVAAFGPKGLAQAARRGLPYLASPIESLDAIAENYAAHAALLPSHVHAASLAVPVMRTVHVAADDAEAARVRDAGARGGLCGRPRDRRHGGRGRGPGRRLPRARRTRPPDRPARAARARRAAASLARGACGALRRLTLLRVAARERHERHRGPLARFAHREVEALERPALRDPLVQDALELVVRDVAGLHHLVDERHESSVRRAGARRCPSPRRSGSCRRRRA